MMTCEASLGSTAHGGRPWYELDLVLDSADGPLDVEVDGVHHTDARGRRRRQDLARGLVLEGLGWRVARVPAWRALAEPDAVVADVLSVRSV